MEGLKLISAEITNFKNISHKKVDFEGKSIVVIGRNEAGKSSLLQAIMSPVNSKVIPEKPIKKGEEKASIELEIGGVLNDEKVKYNIAMYFSQEHQKGKLILSTPDEVDKKVSSKAISELLGHIGFDIMDFIRLGQTRDGKVSVPGVREQIEILKNLMPIEAVKELFKLDKEKQEVYDSRADVNKDIKHQKSMLDGNEYSQEDIEKYSKKIDVEPLKSKMMSISEDIEKHTGVSSRLDANKHKSISLEAEIATLQNKLDQAKKEKADVDIKVKSAEEWLSKNKKPDITELSKELQEANEHNEICDEVSKLEDAHKKLRSTEKKSKEMTSRLKEIEAEKKDVFSKNPLPVKDLSFDDDTITYKGLPLNDKQINTASLIGIGCRIGMAMNPKLRLMVIKDGSLLDKKILKHILTICDKEGYQLLIEMVDQDGGDLSVEFTEDFIGK
jgi:predicted ATP-dependent endonuclease of OLD family